MAITAKELAKKLNLSESAISLALNHKPVSVPPLASGFWLQPRRMDMISPST